MDLRRVQRGDPLNIPASTWNEMLANLEEQPPRGSVFGERLSATDMIVWNGSGLDVPRFGVIGLNRPYVLPADIDDDAFYDNLAFRGAIAASAGGGVTGLNEYQFRWGIAQEAIKIGDIGRVRVAGVTHCFISATPSKQPTFVWPDPAASVEWLVEGDCGARVLWRDPGTGKQKAIVIL